MKKKTKLFKENKKWDDSSETIYDFFFDKEQEKNNYEMEKFNK